MNPTRRPTVLLSYDSPFISSLAPTHDSTGATESYSRSASRALSQLRNRRWLDAALGKEEQEEEDAIVLSEQESETLRSLGVDIEALLAGPDSRKQRTATPNRPRAPRPRERKPVADSSASSRDAEAAIWTRLEENAELIVRVARAQVARTRDSYDEELRRLRRRAEKAARIANRPVPAAGAPVKEEEKEAVLAGEEAPGEKAGRAELEDGESGTDSVPPRVAIELTRRLNSESAARLARVAHLVYACEGLIRLYLDSESLAPNRSSARAPRQTRSAAHGQPSERAELPRYARSDQRPRSQDA